MPGKFQTLRFADLDINDNFFDSLKEDYLEFSQWYRKKSDLNETAMVFIDEEGLGAFIYLKHENETIELIDRTLPIAPRIKIGTLKLADRYQGQRLGEGALGLILWKWCKSDLNDIYITVYEKHTILISQLVRFGFCLVGCKFDGECVYVKSKLNLDYSDPYKSFPFINPSFKKAGYIIINDFYHDTLFPYSELSNTLQESIETSAANGMSKVYIGAQYSPHYQSGEPVLIYRKYTKQDGQKPRYKSCLTSYCIVTNVITVKNNNRFKLTFEELLEKIGNKSIFDKQDMQEKYIRNRNMVVIELLYCGYFGAGNNVNMDWLDNNGYWTKTDDEYPTEVKLSQEQFITILVAGKVDISHVLITN